MASMRPTDDLIAEIYEAALDPCGWTSVLTKISDQLKGAAIITDARSDPDGLPIILFPVRFDVERLRVSIEDYGEPGVNPTFDHARCTSPVGSFFDRRQILDDASFERNAVSRAILFPQGLYEAAACALDRRPDRLSIMALARPQSKGAFSSDEMAFLDTLSGHLRRGMELTARTHENRIANRYIESIIDCLPHGAIAIDETWRVLGANAAANTLLASGDLFDYHNGRIALPNERQQLLLEKAMASNSTADSEYSQATGQCLATARDHPDQLYRLSVLRCDQPTTAHAAGRTIFLLLVRAVSNLDPQIEALVRDCFELTPSEARLAITLANAGTLEETLVRLAITRNTAKTHLRRIFDKTATRNQVELVRLISALQAA